MQLHRGNLRLSPPAGPVADVTLAFWLEGRWQHLPLRGEPTAATGTATGLSARLTIADDGRYQLVLAADFPTRLQLRLSPADVEEVFHIIPACIFGDNNLAGAEPGHFPNLTDEHPDHVSCARYWEFRADRAAMPVSLMAFNGGVAGVSIEPYTDADWSQTTSREGFVRNGLFAELPAACGATLGYRNVPVSFVNKDQWGLSTEHLVTTATVCGRIFVRPASSRQAVHEIVRELYDDHHRSPASPLSVAETATALARALVEVNWQPTREHFTNQRIDDATGQLLPWRTLAEIGWSGGAVVGYPLLAAGRLFDHQLARDRARYVLDWVARAGNPLSGLLWDVCGKHEGQQVNWWWSGYVVKDVHCAYTNGSALYYLLKAHEMEPHDAWLQAACRALDTIAGLQLAAGSFGYTYRCDRPAIVDAEGFAGVWFVPALALAYRCTGEQRYLDSACRGLAFYRRSVQALNCCGTPMDTWKSPEQEGNLGFLRGARLLHEVTGNDDYLVALSEGANYEYLWRYGFPARPEYAPLRGSQWSSVGGSVTSVSNPHIHPMGVYAAAELRYLAAQTGDAYHQRRAQDGLDWGRNIVSLYPDVVGYGTLGVLTERWCPSDGLTIDRNADGSFSSIWRAYNGWAAAAVLEGLVESINGA